MTTIIAILIGIFFVAVGCGLYNMYFDVPKSFSRIADALEESNRLQKKGVQ